MICGGAFQKNAITHTRGDTMLRTVTLKYKGSDDVYVPEEGDEVRFALKHAAMTAGRKQFVDEEPLIYKVIPTDTMLLRLEPEDTKPLDFGTYVYDIQITYSDGSVETPIKEASFTLTPEVD